MGSNFMDPMQRFRLFLCVESEIEDRERERERERELSYHILYGGKATHTDTLRWSDFCRKKFLTRNFVLNCYRTPIPKFHFEPLLFNLASVLRKFRLIS